MGGAFLANLHGDRQTTSVDPTSIHLTLPPEMLAALDAHIERQADKPSRPEAIRRVLAERLK